MKICPVCKETNGNGNTKCFKCGADLPEMSPKEPPTNNTQSLEKTNAVVQNNELNELKKNSERISNMATAVCIIGIILAIVLGFVFQTETVSASYFEYETESSFNWTLCIATVFSSIFLTVILSALSYIAKAIEEK